MILRWLHYAVLFATLAMATSCAPVQGTQVDTPRTVGRGHFAEGALYSCSGVLMGMGGLMGLDVNLQVQTVMLGICSIYAEKVAKAVWDGGVMPRSEQPFVPALPNDPT